jgi:hypothetical protein
MIFFFAEVPGHSEITKSMLTQYGDTRDLWEVTSRRFLVRFRIMVTPEKTPATPTPKTSHRTAQSGSRLMEEPIAKMRGLSNG